MIPQFARAGDETALIELWRVCFPEDSVSFWRWFLEHGPYRPGNTLVQREAGAIVSALQMIPLELSFGGEPVPAHYIYAAATLPAFRGQGRMAQLLALAADEGLRRGQQFSILIVQEPGLLGFYGRSGYIPRVCWNALPPSGEGLVHGEFLRPAEERDLAALDAIYERASAQTSHAVRSRAVWLDQLTLYQKGAAVLEDRGTVKAYCFLDPDGVCEAAGPGADRLAGLLLPAGHPLWTPAPGEDRTISGCVRPLTGKARILLGDAPIYLNLMYN